MRIKSHTIRIAFYVVLGLAVAFVNLALTRPAHVTQAVTATPTAFADTIISVAEAKGDIGSTDGIVLVAVLIVLIIIIPILFRRQAWSNGKRN